MAFYADESGLGKVEMSGYRRQVKHRLLCLTAAILIQSYRKQVQGNPESSLKGIKVAKGHHGTVTLLGSELLKDTRPTQFYTLNVWLQN